MLQYCFFRIGSLLARIAPRSSAYFTASALGEVLYFLSPGRRRNITGNIRHVLGPQATPGDVRRISRGVSRNWAKNYLEFVLMPYISDQEIRRLVEWHNPERLHQALALGKGVILATAHLGNFDMGAQSVVARSIKMSAMVEPLRPEKLFRHVCSLRASHGLAVYSTEFEGIVGCMKSLERGEVVGMVCERDIQGKSRKMKFFGKETTFPVGPVAVALKTGAVLLPVCCARDEHGGLHLHFYEPLALERGNGNGGKHQSMMPNVAMLIAAMESQIRAYPEQWVVLKPVWNSEPSASPAPARTPAPVDGAVSNSEPAPR